MERIHQLLLIVVLIGYEIVRLVLDKYVLPLAALQRPHHAIKLKKLRHNLIREVASLILGLALTAASVHHFVSVCPRDSWFEWNESWPGLPRAAIVDCHCSAEQMDWIVFWSAAMCVYYVEDMVRNWCVMTPAFVLHHCLSVFAAGMVWWYGRDKPQLALLFMEFLPVEYATIVIDLRALLHRHRNYFAPEKPSARYLHLYQFLSQVLNILLLLTYVMTRVVYLFIACLTAIAILRVPANVSSPLVYHGLPGGLVIFMVLNVYWALEVGLSATAHQGKDHDDDNGNHHQTESAGDSETAPVLRKSPL